MFDDESTDRVEGARDCVSHWSVAQLPGCKIMMLSSAINNLYELIW